MCNINVIIRKDRMPDPKVDDLMNIISYLSFDKNDDGEGYFGSDMVFGKSRAKIIFEKKDRWFLVTHQRWATSGKSDEYIHPHGVRNLLLFHNGVFSSLENDNKSDTREYTEKLADEYDKTGDIIIAIQNINKEIIGSYSVVLWDDKTEKLLYYKDCSTSMYFMNTKEYLVISTLKENVDFARRYLSQKGSIREVKEERIYDLLDNMKIIGKFKEAERKVYRYHNYGYDNHEYGGYNQNEYAYDCFKSPQKEPIINCGQNEVAQITYEKDKMSGEEDEYAKRCSIYDFFAEYYTAEVLKINDKEIIVKVHDEEIKKIMEDSFGTELMHEKNEDNYVAVLKLSRSDVEGELEFYELEMQN